MILRNIEINYGEPLFVSTDTHDGTVMVLTRGNQKIELQVDEFNELLFLARLLNWELV